MDSLKMHVQSCTIFSQLWSIPCCSVQRAQQLHGEGRGVLLDAPFLQRPQGKAGSLLFLHSFQNLGVTSLRGTCVLVGGVCFQCMVKWRAMNVLWRKGKEQWGVLISSWRRWVVYSQWNPCSWPRAEGTVFSYTGLGGSGIWKWVKEIHVWACARWFCCLCVCFSAHVCTEQCFTSQVLLITLQQLSILVGIQKEWDWYLHQEQ